MSEGDANPAVYLEVHYGRSGRTFLYQIPEGSMEWKQMARILTAMQPVARAVPPRSVIMEAVAAQEVPTSPDDASKSN